MRTVYVIKSFFTGKYLSIEYMWDSRLMCAEFDNREQAIKIADKTLEESIIIEKIYKL